MSIKASSLPNQLKTSDIIVVTPRLLVKEVTKTEETATVAPPSSSQQPQTQQQQSSSPSESVTDNHEKNRWSIKIHMFSSKTGKKNKLTVTDTPTGDLVVCEQSHIGTPPQQQQDATGGTPPLPKRHSSGKQNLKKSRSGSNWGSFPFRFFK